MTHVTAPIPDRTPVRPPDARRRWSAARSYLLLAGGFLLTIGVAGFAVGPGLPTSPAGVHDGHGHLFGVLATNGWHNLAALGVALPALATAFARPGLAAPVALAVGASHAVVFVAFAIWDPSRFLMAVNGADQVMHAALAGLGVASAVVSRGAGAAR